MSRHSRIPKIRIEGPGINQPAYAIGWGAKGTIRQPVHIEQVVNDHRLNGNYELVWTITILHEDET